MLLVAERDHAHAFGLREAGEVGDGDAGKAEDRVDVVELERVDDEVEAIGQRGRLGRLGGAGAGGVDGGRRRAGFEDGRHVSPCRESIRGEPPQRCDIGESGDQTMIGGPLQRR